MDDIPDDKAATESAGPLPSQAPAPKEGGLREVHPEGETRNGQG